MARYFISDMHFGHEAIIKYASRPFKSVEEMDETIIKNWNNTVTNEDEVFVLGDISFYDEEQTIYIIKKLNGTIHLVCGNHDDNFFPSDTMRLSFASVSKYPIIIDGFYILSHEPVYLNQSMPYVNIHGHLHDNTIKTGGAINQYISVSVEQINYTPISFEEIKKTFTIGSHTLIQSSI